MTEASSQQIRYVSEQLEIPIKKIESTVALLSEGNTVPFIARYRKEVTGDLDEIQIRAVEEKYGYIVELDLRRETILKSIEEQGKLTDDLKAKIVSCTEKAALEDLYLPYKPKRRTRATIAREKGLEPLADRISAQPADGDADAEAKAFIDAEKEIPDVATALQLARDIVAETVAENAEVRAVVRDSYAGRGQLASVVLKDKGDDNSKFKDYFDYKEAVATIPSHRFLAVSRGEKEGVLKLAIEDDDEKLVNMILNKVDHNPASPFSEQLVLAADQFMVIRRRADGTPGSSIIAGYPWFTDWGRDTFIAVRGLCLATGRTHQAREVVMAWAGEVSEGMLPNRFTDAGEEPARTKL